MTLYNLDLLTSLDSSSPLPFTNIAQGFSSKSPKAVDFQRLGEAVAGIVYWQWERGAELIDAVMAKTGTKRYEKHWPEQ